MTILQYPLHTFTTTFHPSLSLDPIHYHLNLFTNCPNSLSVVLHYLFSSFAITCTHSLSLVLIRYHLHSFTITCPHSLSPSLVHYRLPSFTFTSLHSLSLSFALGIRYHLYSFTITFIHTDSPPLTFIDLRLPSLTIFVCT